MRYKEIKEAIRLGSKVMWMNDNFHVQLTNEGRLILNNFNGIDKHKLIVNGDFSHCYIKDSSSDLLRNVVLFMNNRNEHLNDSKTVEQLIEDFKNHK